MHPQKSHDSLMAARFVRSVFILAAFSATTAAIGEGRSDWPTWGGDYANSRYSPLDQINTKNVSDLEVKWVYHTGAGADPFVAFYFSPIVVDDTMYIPDIGNFGGSTQGVIALNAQTGEEKWRTSITLSKIRDFVFILGWRTNRGLGYGDGKVYMATFDARVWALDAKTGQIVNEFRDAPGAPGGFVTIGDPDVGYYLTAPPIFIPKKLVPHGGPASGHDLIIIGTGGSENQVRGFISAYDAHDGKLLWRFFTVPGRGEFGGDTWPVINDGIFNNPFTRGGATVWMPPAFDRESGSLIFGTGNAGPDVDGTHRTGANLFTASVLSIGVADGKRIWHFQEVHHDLWDYDQPNSPILFDLKKGNKTIPAVGAAGKTGWYYVFNRRTGELVHACPEKPVRTDSDVVAPDGSVEQPYPTQPFCESEAFVPQGSRVLQGATRIRNVEPIFTPPGIATGVDLEPWFGPAFDPQPVSNVLVEPGVWGGAEHSPLSHNPTLGLTYIPANIKPMRVTALPEAQPDATHTFLGIAGWWSFGSFADNDAESSGVLVAMDPQSGKVKWRAETDTQLLVGTCATAGNLVFMGETVDNPSDPAHPFEFFTAFDARNGKRLLRWRVPGDVGINAPCISYDVGGHQYIAVAVGGRIRSDGNVRGNNGDAVYVFGLPEHKRHGQGHRSDDERGED